MLGAPMQSKYTDLRVHIHKWRRFSHFDDFILNILQTLGERLLPCLDVSYSQLEGAVSSMLGPTDHILCNRYRDDYNDIAATSICARSLSMNRTSVVAECVCLLPDSVWRSSLSFCTGWHKKVGCMPVGRGKLGWRWLLVHVAFITIATSLTWYLFSSCSSA